MAISLVAVLAAGLAGCGSGSRGASATVVTPDGALAGVRRGDVLAWHGVPYAAAPTGPRRWQPPAPVRPWSGRRLATTPGPGCPQLAAGVVRGAEDCLQLDVYRPAHPGGDLPVMVYLHGGSFVIGRAADVDPGRLVSGGGVVVVSVDYRLGPLGFLAAPGLAAAGSVASGGDFGLEDQQAALRWVRRSITAFGGDPGRVTLFGESAGGISVCDTLASPGTAGLLRAAIDQSGPCAGAGAALPPLPVAAASGSAFAAAVGCRDAARAPACLRTLPVATLLAGPPEVPGGLVPLPWRPAVGTAVLPVLPVAALAGGAVPPLVNGTNLDDGAAFVPPGVATAGAYRAWLQADLGPSAAAAAAEYPLPPGATPADVRAAASALVTDAAFACPAAALDRVAAGHGGHVWAYEFADRQGRPLGAYHSDELGYLFAGVAGRTPTPPGPLATAMIQAWSSLAARGSPGAWAPVDPTGPLTVTRLAPPAPVRATDFEGAHRCAFWAATGP